MNNVICTPSSQEGDPHPIKKAWSPLVRGAVAKPIRLQFSVVYKNIRSIMKIEIRILFFISQWIKHSYLYSFYSTIMQIIKENQSLISLSNYTHYGKILIIHEFLRSPSTWTVDIDHIKVVDEAIEVLLRQSMIEWIWVKVVHPNIFRGELELRWEVRKCVWNFWRGEWNDRVWLGIWLIRYVAVRMASLHISFGIFVVNIKGQATSWRCLFFALWFHFVEGIDMWSLVNYPMFLEIVS